MRGDSSRLEPRHRKPQVPKIGGAFYMSVVDEMRYLGLDPAIVSVHLASDNLASGHAALAREAVMIYPDGVGSDFGHGGARPALAPGVPGLCLASNRPAPGLCRVIDEGPTAVWPGSPEEDCARTAGRRTGRLSARWQAGWQ